MEFKITHTTSYRYGHAAAEAYGEARLTPQSSPSQSVVSREFIIQPSTRVSRYEDHYGNAVEFYSLPFRHNSLTIVNRMIVHTSIPVRPAESLEVAVADARQIFNSSLADVFEYLQPTELVQIGHHAVQWAKKYLPGHETLGVALPRLNEAIHDSFAYTKGVTDNTTPLTSIWKHRKGVCQDFTHIALSVFRTAGLPARYVCGYIEAAPPTKAPNGRTLVGAAATHAWVEVLLPGMHWVALDPTNRQWADDRYVAVSYGRDARDAAPLRGMFKGSGGQKMSAKVMVERIRE